MRPSARSGRWVQPPFRPPSPLSGQLLGWLCVIFRLRPRNPGCSAETLPTIAQGCGRHQPKQSSRTSLRYIDAAPRRSATPSSGSVRCYATMQTDFRRMVFPSDFAWTQRGQKRIHSFRRRKLRLAQPEQVHRPSCSAIPRVWYVAPPCLAAPAIGPLLGSASVASRPVKSFQGENGRSTHGQAPGTLRG